MSLQHAIGQLEETLPRVRPSGRAEMGCPHQPLGGGEVGAAKTPEDCRPEGRHPPALHAHLSRGGGIVAQGCLAIKGHLGGGVVLNTGLAATLRIVRALGDRLVNQIQLLLPQVANRSIRSLRELRGLPAAEHRQAQLDLLARRPSRRRARARLEAKGKPWWEGAGEAWAKALAWAVSPERGWVNERTRRADGE